jgi:two-component system, sensor histidine kinase PdtaS
VVLDRYLTDLCQQIAAASSSPDRERPLVLDADPLIVSTDVAVPLALIVNELITNAIQHSRPPGESGNVHIVLKNHADNFSISISDSGEGPPAAAQAAAGLGTRIVEALARQINATLAKERSAAGYEVTATVPHCCSAPGARQHFQPGRSLYEPATGSGKSQ